MKTLNQEMKDHRDALASLADQIETLAAQLDDLKSDMDDEVTSADEMLHAMKPKNRITAQHFRMLAILNHYGEVPRKHVAKLLGLKESSVDQLANQIRKAHLGDLRSRKGVYILNAIGDDVAGNDNFKLV